MISVYIHIFSSVLLSSITLGPASSKRWSASIKSKPHHWPSWNHCGSRFKFMAKKPGFCESDFGRQSKCLHFADFKAFQTCLVIIRNYLGFLNLVFLRSLFIFDSSILNKKTIHKRRTKRHLLEQSATLNIQPFLPTTKVSHPVSRNCSNRGECEYFLPTWNMSKERRSIWFWQFQIAYMVDPL